MKTFSKKKFFCDILGHFEANHFFLKWTLSYETSYGILTPFQNSKKTVDSILGKHSDRGTEEQKDCSYFIGPFWLPIGVKLDGKLPATIDLEGFDSGQPTMGDSTVP